MREINKVFLSGKREKSLELIEKKLDGNLDDYAGIFTTIDHAFMKKMLESLDDIDETTHPAMSLMLNFTFIHNPFQSSETLSEIKHDKILYQQVIDDSLLHLQEWLYVNEDLVNELFDMCPNIQKQKVAGEQTIVSNLYISPEIEENYLKQAKHRQDKIKRIKILAGIHAQLMYPKILHAIDSNNAKDVMQYMFLFMRSMIQFSSVKAVNDGLNLQKSRKEGGHKEADRKGLKTLIKKYYNKNQDISILELWLLIKNELYSKKFIKPCASYSIKFEFEPTDTSDTGGRLVQRKNNGQEYVLGFEAFRKLFSEVCK